MNAALEAILATDSMWPIYRVYLRRESDDAVLARYATRYVQASAGVFEHTTELDWGNVVKGMKREGGISQTENINQILSNTAGLYDTIQSTYDRSEVSFTVYASDNSLGFAEADLGDWEVLGKYFFTAMGQNDDSTGTFILESVRPSDGVLVGVPISDYYTVDTKNSQSSVPILYGDHTISGLTSDSVSYELRFELSGASGPFTYGETIQVKEGAVILGTGLARGMTIPENYYTASTNDALEVVNYTGDDPLTANFLVGVTSTETATVTAVTYSGNPLTDNRGEVVGSSPTISKALTIGDNQYLLNELESKLINGIFNHNSQTRNFLRLGRDSYLKDVIDEGFIGDVPQTDAEDVDGWKYSHFSIRLRPGIPVPPSPWIYSILSAEVGATTEFVKAEIGSSSYNETSGQYFLNMVIRERALFGSNLIRHPSTGTAATNNVTVTALQYWVENPNRFGHTVLHSLVAGDILMELDTLYDSVNFVDPDNAFDGLAATYSRMEFSGIDVNDDASTLVTSAVFGSQFTVGEVADIRETNDINDPITGTYEVQSLTNSYTITGRVLTGVLNVEDYLHKSTFQFKIRKVMSMTENANGGFLSGYLDNDDLIPPFNRLLVMIDASFDFAGFNDATGGTGEKSVGEYQYTKIDTELDQYKAASSVGDVTNPEYAVNGVPGQYAQLAVDGSTQLSSMIVQLSGSDIVPEAYKDVFATFYMSIRNLGSASGLSGSILPTYSRLTRAAGSASSSDFSNPSNVLTDDANTADATITTVAKSMYLTGFSTRPGEDLDAWVEIKIKATPGDDGGGGLLNYTEQHNTLISSSNVTNDTNFVDATPSTVATATLTVGSPTSSIKVYIDSSTKLMGPGTAHAWVGLDVHTDTNLHYRYLMGAETELNGLSLNCAYYTADGVTSSGQIGYPSFYEFNGDFITFYFDIFPQIHDILNDSTEPFTIEGSSVLFGLTKSSNSALTSYTFELEQSYLIWNERPSPTERCQAYLSAEKNADSDIKSVPFDLILDGVNRLYNIPVMSLYEKLLTGSSLDKLHLYITPTGDGGSVDVEVSFFKNVIFQTLDITQNFTVDTDVIQFDMRVDTGDWLPISGNLLPTTTQANVIADLSPIWNPVPGTSISDYDFEFRLRKDTLNGDFEAWVEDVAVNIMSVPGAGSGSPPSTNDGQITLRASVNGSEEVSAVVMYYDYTLKSYYVDITDAFNGLYSLDDLYSLKKSDLKFRVDASGAGAIDASTVDIYGIRPIFSGTPDGDISSDLFVSCQGNKDDADGTYTGTPSALIEKFGDVIWHLLDQIGGFASADWIDTASITALRAGDAKKAAWQILEKTELTGILDMLGYCRNAVIRMNDENKYSLFDIEDASGLTLTTADILEVSGVLGRQVHMDEVFYKFDFEFNVNPGTGETELTSAVSTADVDYDIHSTYPAPFVLPVNDGTTADAIRDEKNTLFGTARDRYTVRCSMLGLKCLPGQTLDLPTIGTVYMERSQLSQGSMVNMMLLEVQV